jgi:hypothetical protein
MEAFPATLAGEGFCIIDILHSFESGDRTFRQVCHGVSQCMLR